MNVKTILLAVSLGGMLIACNDNSNQGQQASVSEYPVATVKKQSAVHQSVYPATVKGQEDIEIRPRIDGFIKEIYVDEGAVVRKGQPLFKIDSPASEQNLRTARASVESAKAQLNTAQVNVDRIRPLAERGIISNVQLATAQDSYATAQASLSQAQASLANAEATLSWTNVTSPVDGVVGEIPYRLGSLVSSSNVLTSVANTGHVYAYFSMNEKILKDFLDRSPGSNQKEKINNMPEVTLQMADGTEYAYKGKIETITGSVNVTTGTANLRARFPNPNGELRSGTSGKIFIPYVMEDVFVIPQKATFSQQDKILVYQVEQDSVSQKIITAVSTADGKNYIVTSGLTDGEKIVTDGVATLRNGTRIQPVEAQ